MLESEDGFEELDDIEDSLVAGELDEDDDFEAAFDSISPDPSPGRSGSRPIPPPPPKRKKK
jgi:hypothetical protein